MARIERMKELAEKLDQKAEHIDTSRDGNRFKAETALQLIDALWAIADQLEALTGAVNYLQNLVEYKPEKPHDNHHRRNR